MGWVEKCMQPDHIKEKLFEYVKNPQGFLLLAGINGTGKTYSARSVLCDILHITTDPLDQAEVITQSDLNIKWQKDFAEYGNTFYRLENLISKKILILDDIGTRKPSDSFMDFLYCLVDKRYSDKEKLCTIVTTNLNSQQMQEMFGGAFTSRVASGIICRMDGPDRRIPKF